MNTSLSLDSLASAINAAHERCEQAYRTVLADARSAGELLLQAKSQVPYGQWLNWIEKNCTFSDRTARHYMQIASHWEEIQSTSATVADLGVKGAIEAIADKNAPEVVNKKITPIATKPTSASLKSDIRPGDRITVTDLESPEYGQELEVSEVVQDAIALVKKGGETYPLLVNQVEVVERPQQPSIPSDETSGGMRSLARDGDWILKSDASAKQVEVAAAAGGAKPRPITFNPPSKIKKEVTVAALQDLLQRILDECGEYLPQELIDEARELL